MIAPCCVKKSWINLQHIHYHGGQKCIVKDLTYTIIHCPIIVDLQIFHFIDYVLWYIQENNKDKVLLVLLLNIA